MTNLQQSYLENSVGFDVTSTVKSLFGWFRALEKVRFRGRLVWCGIFPVTLFPAQDGAIIGADGRAEFSLPFFCLPAVSNTVLSIIVPAKMLQGDNYGRVSLSLRDF